MAKISVLIVGTRKGAFLLESDEARRDWRLRGPFCEGWPIYHAIHDAGRGVIYAAAASEWHGSGVRYLDLGETWTQSSGGALLRRRRGRAQTRRSGLTAHNGRLFAGTENPGVFESRDGGETWSLLTTLEGQPGSEGWNNPANEPPGHLGVPAIRRIHDPSRYWVIAGRRHLRDDRRRRLVEAPQPWPPRRLAARERGGRLLRAQARHVTRQRAALSAYPRRHAPQRRRRPHLDRDHRRPADRVHRPRRAPARPGPST